MAELCRYTPRQPTVRTLFARIKYSSDVCMPINGVWDPTRKPVVFKIDLGETSWRHSKEVSESTTQTIIIDENLVQIALY
jgi:hypothetical protein